MKVKIPKISDEDFDGLLPSASSVPSNQPAKPVVAPKVAQRTKDGPSEVAPVAEQLAAVKASKSSKSKTVSDKAISVRLTFDTKDFKSLTLLALNVSEKIGKRVSVTSLLLMHTNKLIQKGNANG